MDSNTKATSKHRHHCDHCTGVIWSVVQASYICADCSYRVHHKCVNSVARICAHIIASENNEPIAEICPEDGLAVQKYKCFECESSLSFSKCSARSSDIIHDPGGFVVQHAQCHIIFIHFYHFYYYINPFSRYTASILLLRI